MGAVLCKLCGTVCMTACCDPCGGGCMSKNVPWLPHHLTAKIITQWLQDKGGLELDNAAATVALQPFAIGEGLMSIMYRVTVTYIYPPKNGLNTTFVCKLSPPAAKPRFIGALLSLFKSEVNFYNKNLRESTGMDSPLCYYAGVASNGRYCILLEDLSPAKAGKQIEGVSIENARDATRCLATFHAKYHGKVRSDATFDEWLLLADDTEYWKLVKGSYDGACPTLQSRIDTIFKTTFEGDDPKGFSRVALTFKDNYDKYIALMVLNATSSKSTSKTTLTHGDFRAENMFFNAPTTMGESKDNDKGGMRLVDFQLMKESSGPAELCYFIGTSMTIEDRRKYECELLQLYYDEMKANGADISMQDVLLEYQAGKLYVVYKKINIMG